ncbi:hypothetical protein [Nonomuraea maritima]|nr:hypothetical protein [Nonomuraea maritima]
MAAAPIASTSPPAGISTHLNAAVSTPLSGFSTPAMATSAVVLVVALLALAAVLVVRSRRGPLLAADGYVEPAVPTPVPEPSAPEPGGGDEWRRQLMEAIEAAAAEQDSAPPVAPYGQGTPQPSTNPPVADLGAEPQETGAWTPSFEPYVPPGPLESLFGSSGHDHSAPADGEHGYGDDEGPDDDTMPGAHRPTP